MNALSIFDEKNSNSLTNGIPSVMKIQIRMIYFGMGKQFFQRNIFSPHKFIDIPATHLALFQTWSAFF